MMGSEGRCELGPGLYQLQDFGNELGLKHPVIYWKGSTLTKVGILKIKQHKRKAQLSAWELRQADTQNPFCISEATVL